MSLYEELAENFWRWEKRGRGGLTYSAPVRLEPPFAPFPGHRLSPGRAADDGTRPTRGSRLADRLWGMLSKRRPTPAAPEPEHDPEEGEAEPKWLDAEAFAAFEFIVRAPEGFPWSPDAAAALLATLSVSEGPLSFEVVGTGSEIRTLMTAREEDAGLAQAQLRAQFEGVETEESEAFLEAVWSGDDGMEYAVVDFGLGREFMFPLASPGRADPLSSLIGAMAGLGEGEAAVYQVLFEPLVGPWAEHAMAAVSRDGGKPFFDDGAHLLRAAAEKMSKPLWAAVVRLAAKAPEHARAWEIVRGMASALRLFARQGGQSFRPLPCGDYEHGAHCADVALRRSRRCGMILNMDELAGLAHLPSSAVREPKLLRAGKGLRGVPAVPNRPGSVCIGWSDGPAGPSEVRLSAEHRLRHAHVIGSSGTGKSTLLLGMIRQDMEGGQGLAVLDPHGDLIEAALGCVPEERIADVVLLDPSDEEFSVGLNVLSAKSEFERAILASDLVAVFRRLSTSWGDQMNSVLGNAIHAFLEHPEGGTLLELRRFLVEPEYRAAVLDGVADPEIRYYWTRTFPLLGAGKSVGPILTRLEGFLAPKPIRRMVGQPEGGLDIAGLMDGGKILFAKLSQGLMGTENSRLLGCLLVMRFQMAAISRQRMSASERRPFFLYIDEFQDFVTPSMAEILTGARKYGLGMTLSHQTMRQLQRDDEVAAAVLGNTWTRIAFRTGDEDARQLEKGFEHFEAKDLTALRTGEAIARLGGSSQDFKIRTLPLEENRGQSGESRRAEVTETSRRLNARSRAEIDTLLAEKLVVKPPPMRAPANPPVLRTGDEPASVSEGPPPRPAEPEPKTEIHGQEAEPAPSEPEESPQAISDLPEPSSNSAARRIAAKGGPEHKALQARLKASAEAAGFRAMTEYPVGATGKTIDLVLLKKDQKIACELSVTTPGTHEIANASKCLEAGFEIVLLVTTTEYRKSRLQKTLSDLAVGKPIRCVSPGEAEEFFQNSAPPENNQSIKDQSAVRGWTVTRSFTKLAPREQIIQTKRAFVLLAEEMAGVTDAV